MKSRSIKGAAAGVALVTVAAMSAAAMPKIFSESDSFFAGSDNQRDGSLTEVPDLPDETTIAAAKGNPDAQAKLREDLKDILDKSNKRLAEVEGQTLSANEKARELSEAAAEARRDAETASQQATLATEENEQVQENAGEAVADMYRNGGLSTEEFMLGDEDALRAEQNGQQIAQGLTGQASDSEYAANSNNAISENDAERAQAQQDAADDAQAKAEAEQRRLEEQKARELEEAQQEAENDRLQVAAVLQESEGLSQQEAEETTGEMDDDRRRQTFEENLGVATASSQTSPTSTESVEQAPVTPTETETASPTETATEAETPSPTATPTPTQTSSPTPSQSSTPSSTPTPTPTPTPTKTAAPAAPSGNMSAATSWAVNKTNEAGTYYSWGGNGPKGYDCSGYTLAAFQQAGKSLPRTSSAQYGAAKQYVSLSNLQPGDLVFWSNNGSQSGVYHVAIYIGNGQIAHARNPSTGITVTGLHYSPYNMMSVGGRY